jgi:hypothetical protein
MQRQRQTQERLHDYGVGNTNSFSQVSKKSNRINRSLPKLSMPFGPSPYASSHEICCEALKTFSDDWLEELDSHSSDEDDFEDNPFEPNPINENRMTVSNGHGETPMRLASLYESLKDVLHIESPALETLGSATRKRPALEISSEVCPQGLLKKNRHGSRMPLDSRRFRDYQDCQWTTRYKDLFEFKKQQGHCCVPHAYAENQVLARWVKRQRYQYKLKIGGKTSTMTMDRIQMLQQLGFVWDSHEASWMDRLNEIQDYAASNGDCNVPSNHADTKLSSWVKCQRRQYKLFKEGKQSNFTAKRIVALENIGFEWEIRKSSNKKSRRLSDADTENQLHKG